MKRNFYNKTGNRYVSTYQRTLVLFLLNMALYCTASLWWLRISDQACISHPARNELRLYWKVP